MRPVTIPNAPPGTYDEATQLAVDVAMPAASGGAGGAQPKQKKAATITRTKAQLAALMGAQITNWINAGAPLFAGIPQLAPADAGDYEIYLDKLGAGRSNWGDARRPLIGAIGAYCSYCGSSVFSHLAIEHKLPKSTFPANAFQYGNFLLACSSCNSAKGNTPNQATVPGNPRQTAAAINLITNAGGPQYYWPDFNWPALPARPFPFQISLCWITARRNRLDFGNPVLVADANRLGQMYVAGTLAVDRGLYYEPYGPANRYKHYFGLSLVPAAGLTAPETAAVQRVIDLASLNRVLKADQAANTIDRRIETRTKAYFTARIVKHQLDQAAATPALLPLILQQARTTIANTGHWLVWLIVFRNANYGGVAAQDIIRQCLAGTSAVNWVV